MYVCMSVCMCMYIRLFACFCLFLYPYTDPVYVCMSVLGMCVQMYVSVSTCARVYAYEVL
jgi:hypothetical protein